jgi:hypothetical protein
MAGWAIAVVAPKTSEHSQNPHPTDARIAACPNQPLGADLRPIRTWRQSLRAAATEVSSQQNAGVGAGLTLSRKP